MNGSGSGLAPTATHLALAAMSETSFHEEMFPGWRLLFGGNITIKENAQQIKAIGDSWRK